MGDELLVFHNYLYEFKERFCQIPCLWVIYFRAVELQTLKFKVTGDLHFLMPIFGLLPCGSSNPCIYCPLERRKVGGVPVWQSEQVQLRTFGSLETGVYISLENYIIILDLARP